MKRNYYEGSLSLGEIFSWEYKNGECEDEFYYILRIWWENAITRVSWAYSLTIVQQEFEPNDKLHLTLLDLITNNFQIFAHMKHSEGIDMALLEPAHLNILKNTICHMINIDMKTSITRVAYCKLE